MNETNYLRLLLIACCFFSNSSHAQWRYACNDTLTYHNHQNGELMIQSSTNKLYSMQNKVTANQYRLDVLENDQWNNVITGTDGLDFVVSDNEIDVLRKVGGQFVIENYDLDGNLNWSSTSPVYPLLSAQYYETELLRSTTDSLYIHFKDLTANGSGSVFLYDGTTWSDLNAGKLAKVLLDNSQRLTGLKITTQNNPAMIYNTFTRFNTSLSQWDSVTTVPVTGYHLVSDFIVSQNDSLYLAVVSSYNPFLVIPDLEFFAVKENVTSTKMYIQGIVNEYFVSMRIVEERQGDVILFYSFRELGPWGLPMAARFKHSTQTWVGGPFGLSMLINSMTSEYTDQMPVYHDVVVDSTNTYYANYSFHTDFFQSNGIGSDSIHSHIRQYNHCPGYINQVNVIDTVGGNLVSDLPDFYDFQWIDCSTNDPIAGANDPVFPIPGNGEYALVVSNGECSDTSACFDLTTLGMNDPGSDQHFRVFPNPANDVVFVSTINDRVYDFRLMSMDGRTVRSGRRISGTFMLDVSTLKSGMYTLQLHKESGVGSFSIVVH